MATPTKDKLMATLKGLGVEPPADGTTRELQALIRKTKALPREAPGGDRPPRPARMPAAARPPSAPAQNPRFASPAVAPPARRSERARRPWDPFAGH